MVPDDRLRAAAKALLVNLEFLASCPDSTHCLSSSPDRFTPPAAAHLHIDYVSHVTVGLFVQSDTLWFLPALDGSLVADSQFEIPPSVSSYLCLASDSTVLPPRRPGRGSGVFQSGHHPVLVPKPHVLLEAFLRLYARDIGKKSGSNGMAMISYMEEYVDDDGFLNAELLPPQLAKLYKELRAGPSTVRKWTRDLREALGVPLGKFEDA